MNFFTSGKQGKSLKETNFCYMMHPNAAQRASFNPTFELLKKNCVQAKNKEKHFKFGKTKWKFKNGEFDCGLR